MGATSVGARPLPYATTVPNPETLLKIGANQEGPCVCHDDNAKRDYGFSVTRSHVLALVRQGPSRNSR